MSHLMFYGHVDLAEVCLWTFFLFFAGLIFYLRQEDHREGYPMEEDSGEVQRMGFLDRPAKRYIRPHDMGVALMPDDRREGMPVNSQRTAPWSGSAIEPTGNPLVDGVGPAAFAIRPDWPDMTVHGDPRLKPMRILGGHSVARQDTDPRGLPMVGCDGAVAGTVVDIWVDTSENIVRYAETELDGSLRHVLTPMTMITINTSRGVRGIVKTDSIRADQFAAIPGTANADVVTLNEEERIVAYHGGGYLYAKASRMEPVI